MSITCNICGSNKSVYLFSRADKVFGTQKIYRCKNCGLVSSEPLPNPSVLENHYNKDFFKRFDYVQSGIIWKKFYELNLAYIERIKNKGKLLEVGCGLGHFLNIAKKRGWETFGVELSEFAANYASNNFKLKIYNGILEEAKFPDNQFDVVVLWATLEHMVHPFRNLVEIYRILAPGGLLALSVPNHNSLLTRLHGMKNTDMQYCGHIYHFSYRTLKAMLSRAGFSGLRRIAIFGGSPKRSLIQDLLQFIARKMNVGSDLRIIAFKKET